MIEQQKKNLLQDLTGILISIAIALFLVMSGILEAALEATKHIALLETFFAGIFFTSVFTTAPAIVILGEIAQRNSIVLTAAIGAVGSLCGDLIIFRFVRDRLSEDLMALIGKKGKEKLRHILSRKIFWWFSPLVAACIIASPLPDELGILILGLTNTRTFRFALFSYAANFAGIIAIGLVAQSLL